MSYYDVIYPTINDVIEKESPKLLYNLIDKPYESEKLYLKTHYRLLNEEFLRPLNEAIKSIRELVLNKRINPWIINKRINPSIINKQIMQELKINVFKIFHFRILRKKDYKLLMYFDKSQYNDNNWEESSHLMPGSLLVISSDYFDKSIIFARIESRNGRLLNKKRKFNEIQIAFDSQSFHYSAKDFLSFHESMKSQNYIAIQSPTYFDGVRHTLAILKDPIKVNHIPFKDHVLHLNTNIKSPPYLTKHKTYAFDCSAINSIMSKTDESEVLTLPLINMTEIQMNDLRKSLKMDDSQFEAYYGALTKQFALIQGPPGTGKTNVALCIVKTLIDNCNKLPILILCYKNSSLDQFMEKILEFTKNIARVGGQCKSKKLEKYKCTMRQFSPSRNVLGMTITGAAIHKEHLNRMNVKIVIVEEAAEIFECHLIAALPDTVNHLILIGDHCQLKPVATVFKLMKYNFDTSFFERMIMNHMPFYQLKVQYRMRPSIAELLRVAPIYETLEDAECVKNYARVKFVEQDLFFKNHSQYEIRLNDADNSLINKHEANYIIDFVKYLVFREIQCNKITILAMYNAQRDLIERMTNHYKEIREVRVSTVDGFQGEENDFIIISFVRSNNEGKIGFLNVMNRICVALSRAKYGLYCIGNFENMAKVNKKWRNVIEYVKRGHMFGDDLKVGCECFGFNWKIHKNAIFYGKLKNLKNECDCFKEKRHSQLPSLIPSLSSLPSLSIASVSTAPTIHSKGKKRRKLKTSNNMVLWENGIIQMCQKLEKLKIAKNE